MVAGGWQLGSVAPPPWNLKIVTLNAVSVQNTLNFSLAHLALASDTFKFSLKTSKKSKYFVCAFGSLKVGSFLPVHAVLPPLKKFLRAPMVQCQSCTKYSPALVASSRAKAATNTISHNHQVSNALTCVWQVFLTVTYTIS